MSHIVVRENFTLELVLSFWEAWHSVSADVTITTLFDVAQEVIKKEAHLTPMQAVGMYILKVN